MPQLDTSFFISQLFWLFITFGFVLWAIKKIYIPTFYRIFGERESRISGGIQNAEKAKLEAEKIQEQYNQSLAHARKTASIIMSEMAVEMKYRAEKSKKALEMEIEKLTSESQQRIISVKNETKSELERITIETVKIATLQFVGIEMDEQNIKDKIEQVKAKEVSN